MNQIADSTLMKNQITPIGFLNDGFPNQIPSYVEKGPTINSQKSCSISSQIISFFSIPKRYQISILTCIGLIISFSVRCNMGIVTASLKAKNGNATKNITNLDFNWSNAQTAMLHSSFFWGYMITQIPAGFLATRFPANRVFGLAILTSCSLNILLPFFAKTNFIALVVVRVIQGFFDGIAFPSVHGMWRYWAPPLERSRLATIAFTGIYAGAIVGFPFSNYLINCISWECSFYVYGCSGIVWSIIWFIISSPCPEKCWFISKTEIEYIKNCIGQPPNVEKNSKKIPICAIMLSIPVWAIIVATFCRNWSFFIVTTYQSQFFSESFGLDIKDKANSYLSSLPHVIMAISCISGGQLADFLRLKLETTTVRKIMTCVGLGMEGLCFFAISLGPNSMIAITFISIGVGFSGFSISGYNVNQLDLSPRYTCIIMGISNTIGTLAGVLCPIAVETFVKNGTLYEWCHVFILISIIHLSGIIFYGIFASSKKQAWSELNEVSDDTQDKNKIKTIVLV